ncbi:MAG: TRAP transporter substrate-binding protein [Deltaproteobacteria bacterium]|jgi:tripartite ATP-independent transporter DctP family solute receptor|nr:TRAP transporter substrate-binding protein [Deltaproteobacteria bacterium]
MKKVSFFLVTCLFICLSASLAFGQLALKAGHVLAPDHPYQFGLERFAELVKERTNGQITVDAFHSSQLGNERELIEALQLGTVDITIVSTAPLSGFTNEFLIYDLPFLFRDTATARRILDSPFGQKAFDSISDLGLVGLVYFENGFRHVTNSKLPAVNPADVNGLKIRTMENKIHMASFRVLGASPTPMAFGELYTALQQKTIDAEENPVPIIYTSKFYEVQKYCSLTGHFYAPTPFLISAATWERLTDDQKAIMTQAAKEARDYERELIDQQNNDFVAKLKAEGMEVIEVDKDAWFKAMEPVYKEFESTIGADNIKEIQALINAGK